MDAGLDPSTAPVTIGKLNAVRFIPPMLASRLENPAQLAGRALVTDGSGELVAWGDWGVAAWLDLAYRHPRTGALIENRQAVRVPRDEEVPLRIGARAELVCWGIMPSGMLRHPILLRWL